MIASFFKSILNKESDATAKALDQRYQPKKGDFFRTLDYPVPGNTEKSHAWMEAVCNPQTKKWTVWSKSVQKRNDELLGKKIDVLTSRAIKENTYFVDAFDSLMTFELAQQNAQLDPLATKNQGALGGEYFKQFAWREGLVISKSGRLYQTSAENINADNTFDMADIIEAKKFLDREAQIQFVEVPTILPQKIWPEAYKNSKNTTDTRLNVLLHRYEDHINNFDMALQIISHETPEVFFACLEKGFEARVFHEIPEQHWKLIEASINREDSDTLDLLAKDGISFFINYNNTTPINYAISRRRYGHMQVMLAHAGNTLVNYAPDNIEHPALQAIKNNDVQAFSRLDREGIDFDWQDKNGWFLIHHAFDKNFIRAAYAWLDSGKHIDQTISGTNITGLSIARTKKLTSMIDFAIAHGANQNVETYVPTKTYTHNTQGKSPWKKAYQP